MCGITGSIKRYESDICINKMKILTIGNRDRGTTSTGIAMVDKDGKHYVNKVMKGPLLSLEDGDLFDANNIPSVCIVHNRAPSIGTLKTIDQAHPVEYDNILLVHNGTIHNEEALAEKYGVDIDHGDTDTTVLAKILNKKEFDVLSDYFGAASLLWMYKDEPDSLYVFRGESKTGSYTAFTSEERPLYTYEGNEGFYFGSVEDYLEIIADNKDDAEEYVNKVKANVVIKCSTGESTPSIIKTIDRSKAQQTAAYKPYVAPGSKNVNQSTKAQMSIGTGAGREERGSVCTISNLTEFYKKYSIKDDLDYGIISEIDTRKGFPDEFVDEDLIGSRIHYYKSRYWRNNNPVNGIYHVFSDGTINPVATSGTSQYAFIQGWLLKDMNDYKGLVLNTLGLVNPGTPLSLELLSGKTDMPILKIFKTTGNTEDLKYYKNKTTLYTSVYEPLFASIKYYVFDRYGYIESAINFLLEDLTVGDVVLTNEWKVIKVTDINGTFDDSYSGMDKNNIAVEAFIEDILLLNDSAPHDDLISPSIAYIISASPIADNNDPANNDIDDGRYTIQDIHYCRADAISATEGAIEEIKAIGTELFQNHDNSLRLVEVCESEIDKLKQALKILSE